MEGMYMEVHVGHVNTCSHLEVLFRVEQWVWFSNCLPLMEVPVLWFLSPNADRIHQGPNYHPLLQCPLLQIPVIQRGWPQWPLQPFRWGADPEHTGQHQALYPLPLRAAEGGEGQPRWEHSGLPQTGIQGRPAPGPPHPASLWEGEPANLCHHRPDWAKAPPVSSAAAGARGGLQAQGLSAGDQKQPGQQLQAAPWKGSVYRAPLARWRRLLIQRPVHCYQTRPSPGSFPSLPAAEVLGEQVWGPATSPAGAEDEGGAERGEDGPLEPAGVLPEPQGAVSDWPASIAGVPSEGKVQVRRSSWPPGLWGGRGWYQCSSWSGRWYMSGIALSALTPSTGLMAKLRHKLPRGWYVLKITAFQGMLSLLLSPWCGGLILFIQEASLVAQTVKKRPAIWVTWVWSLGLGRSPGEGHGKPLQYSCLGNPMDRRPDGLQSMGSQSPIRLSNLTLSLLLSRPD